MTTASRSCEGHLDRVEDGWALGWAWRVDMPRMPIDVTLLVDDVAVATQPASGYRADLEQAGKGDGRHAFEIALPPEARDGHPHRIRVVYAGTGNELIGSPMSVTLNAPLRDESSIPSLHHGYRSRFGGLWTDREDARGRLDRQLADATITSADAALLAAWIDEGFVVLPQAVSHDWIDRLDAEVEQVWNGNGPTRYFVEFWEGDRQSIVPAGPAFRDRRVKLLDLHGQSDSARRILFADPIVRFLALIFDGPALAFQSLFFRWGSGQDMHQDSAFVKVNSPLEMAASWVALEDVSADSGELEYYVGSHRLDDYLFDGRHKWMPFRSQEYPAFVDSLHTRSQAQDLARRRFLPKKGDVLIWSADLVHGGSAGARPGVTRKSLVTHYCPAACSPVYGNAGPARARERYSDSAYYACSERV